MTHTHVLDPRLMECVTCRATYEQIFRGEPAHPGKPTSERIWELIFRLVRMRLS